MELCAPSQQLAFQSLTWSGSFQGFVPRRVVDWYCHTNASAVLEPTFVPIRAVVAFLDVSGFTPMTEKLSERGPEGAEVICAILSEYFTLLMELLCAYGGDVNKFAGDALLVSFRLPDEEAPERDLPIALSAVQCAMQCASLVFERQGFPLRLKATLGVGRAFMVHVGKEERWEVFLAGPSMLQLSATAACAVVGATVVSAQLWTIISDHVHGLQHARESTLVCALKKRIAPLVSYVQPAERQLPSRVEEAISLYVPEPARSHIRQGLALSLLANIRTVTIAFIKLTSIAINDASMLESLYSACSVCLSALKRYGGVLRQFLQEDKGITCMCVFGLPGQSSGDDAVCALKAVVYTQQLLTARGLHSSVGVATGKAYCGVLGSRWRHEYAVVGAAVNLSARLMEEAIRSLGHDDGVLVDSRTQQLSQKHFTWQALPPVLLKGMERAVSVFRPTSKAKHKRLFCANATCVGRSSELARLKASVRSALLSGASLMLLIEGAQGLGKSLLCETLVRDMNLVALKGETKGMESRTPLFVISRLIQRLLHIRFHCGCAQLDGACSATFLSALLCGTLEEGHRSDLLPLLCLLNPFFRTSFTLSREVAALQAVHKRAKLFELLSTLIHCAKLQLKNEARPVVFVIDEAHHMSDSSWEFLLRQITFDAPQVWIVLHRPMGAPPEAYNALLRLSRVQKLSLAPLSDAQLVELLCAELSVLRLPPAVTSRVLPKAQGNPLFALELLRSLLAANACRLENGVLQVDAKALAAVALPDAIELAVFARIDTQDPVKRLLLSVCSCIGSSFSVAMLSAVLPLSLGEEQVLRKLIELEEGGFLSCQHTRTENGRVSFVFAQALVEEVVYASSALALRQKVHSTLASWYVEQLVCDNEKDVWLLLTIATHYERAGQFPSAAEFLQRSGDMSAFFGNTSDARAAYEKALSLEEHHPGAVSKAQRVYFRRMLVDFEWLASEDLSDECLISRYRPVFAGFVNLHVPTSAKELELLLPDLRQQWIHKHFTRPQRLGSASSLDRPVFVELAKAMFKLYRVLLLRMSETAPSRMWCIFWLFHLLNLAELADAPDLCFYYSLAPTVSHALGSYGGRIFRVVMPRHWQRLAAKAATQRPTIEFMVLQAKLFSSMFSAPDWKHMILGYERVLHLWRQLTPQEMVCVRALDSVVNYEESLAVYGAGLVVLGKFARAYEIGNELSQITRGKSFLFFREVAHQHMAISLIFMNRLDEAEAIQKLIEEQGMNKHNERGMLSWTARSALLHVLRGRHDLALLMTKSIIEQIPRMSSAWFLAIYYATLLDVYLQLWKHYGVLQSGRVLDISANLPPCDEITNGSGALRAVQFGADVCLDKLWEVGNAWPSLLATVWLMQGKWFTMAQRQEKALYCCRRALRLAEEQQLPIWQARSHFALGTLLSSSAEATHHLQRAVAMFEESNSAWESTAARKNLQEATNAFPASN